MFPVTSEAIGLCSDTAAGWCVLVRDSKTKQFASVTIHYCKYQVNNEQFVPMVSLSLLCCALYFAQAVRH